MKLYEVTRNRKNDIPPNATHPSKQRDKWSHPVADGRFHTYERNLWPFSLASSSEFDL